MKKKIAILGSTGSIGKTTINLIKNNKKKFEVKLLSTNKKADILLNQAKTLNVKNVVIYNKQIYQKYKNRFIKNKINVYPDLIKLSKILKKKIQVTVCGISGLEGLIPLLSSIEMSKTIAVANKESIICAWPIIYKKLQKYNTNLIPIDSEHFSVWKIIQNINLKDVEEIYLTASGGPFFKKKYSEIKNVNPKKALKHPNWKMGKKITIDSATMMNKVFEIIEANKLFKFNIKKIKILIHPTSYIHSIVKFKNGTLKMLAHETDMKIPIGSAIFDSYNHYDNLKQINLKKINNMSFYQPKINQFPTLKFINKLTNKDTYLEVILVTANDELVKNYLERKIKYSEIILFLNKILNMPIFKRKFKKKQKSVKEINQVVELVKSKVKNLV
tara:strand:- start:719 stop:1879 length:1161 start_codon:yes stop_codon:yes gene_type:complete